MQKTAKEAPSVRITVYVQPRAAHTAVAGMHNGLVKVRLAAPPVDGAANVALVAFIAEQLGIPNRCVRIVAGQTSRQKVVEIDGVTPEAISTVLR